MYVGYRWCYATLISLDPFKYVVSIHRTNTNSFGSMSANSLQLYMTKVYV